MSNGILSALKQHNGSLDELAALPQTFIMQMAQRKEISPDMVAPILARKAEMAEATARSKALRAQGAPSTSIMDQIMQKNATAEQPPMTDGRDMGVAQLPVEEPQYAGGGIISFDKGGQAKAETPPEPLPGESESAYMQRVKAVYGMGNEFFKARNYNPFAKAGDLYDAYQRNIGQPFAEGVKKFTDEPLGEQAAKFRSYAQKPKTEAGIAALAPKSSDSEYEEQGRNAYVSTPTPVPPSVTKQAAQKAANVAAAESKVDSKAAEAEKAQSSTDELIAKYEKMIMGDPAESKKAKDEAKWARLMEAGLGIMGGTSSNFAENVGKGATQAMKGYAEDVKGLRAEETAKLNQLASLGLKGAQLKQEAQKLGITAKHYDDWYKAKMAELGEMGATRRDAAGLRADTARDNRIANYAGKLLATGGKYMDNPDLAYQDAERVITGKSAPNQFDGFSGRPLK